MHNLNHACIFFRQRSTTLGLKYSNSKDIIALAILFLNKLNLYYFLRLTMLKDYLPFTLHKIFSLLSSSTIFFNLLRRIFARYYTITSISSEYCQFNILMSLGCLNECFVKADNPWIVIIYDCDCAFDIISTQRIFSFCVIQFYEEVLIRLPLILVDYFNRNLFLWLELWELYDFIYRNEISMSSCSSFNRPHSNFSCWILIFFVDKYRNLAITLFAFIMSRSEAKFRVASLLIANIKVYCIFLFLAF